MIFGLNAEKRYPERVFENESGVFVIRWEGEEGISRAKYEEEKQEYREMLKRMKEEELFRNWLDNLRRSASIEILKPLDRARMSKPPRPVFSTVYLRHAGSPVQPAMRGVLD
jgi:hypothetical protein